MTNKEQRQEALDKLKEEVAGTELIKWEDIKRTTSFDASNWVDSLQKENINNDPKTLFPYIEEQLSKELNIVYYRELKDLILYYKNNANEEFLAKLFMTRKEFEEHIDECLERTNTLIFETNQERYEEAEKLLADEEDFKELLLLHNKYHEVVKVLAIESIVEDQKKLTNNKVNLLDFHK